MKQVISPAIEYRPDIDGLRALAVLAVLFFHADIGCSGGFVGVDIFFVISGFLISSLILKKLETGTFSLIEFWERRIRRILPAWTAVVLVSLVAGWFLFLPPDFATLGKSVIAQATLLSNMFFYMQTKVGYFAASPDTMPLLHTWSLAVEEQFYILFPLLLFIPTRWKRITFYEIIICLWVASFIGSVLGTRLLPVETFYFLPLRAWELLTGAMVAACYKDLPANKVVREIAGWLGLVLMFYAIFFYDRHTRFPGLAALAPCLGAALVILSSKEDFSLVGRMLSFKPAVFIGLVSYSLYLWHWPLLVFAKYLATEELSLPFRMGLLAASLGLAIISWRYIETPIRKGRILKARRQIFGMAGGCVAIFVLVGFGINHQGGWPQRLPPKALKYLDVAKNIPFRNEVRLDAGGAARCVELGSQSTNQSVFIMIYGDSHAMAVTPVIDELCRKYSKRGNQATSSATPPILGYIRGEGFGRLNDSPSTDDVIVSYVAQNHVRNVILAARWHEYSDAVEFKTHLALTIRQLQDSGATVYLLKDVPAPNFDVPRLAAVMAMNDRNMDKLTFSCAKYKAEERDLQPAFEMARQLGAVVLDPSGYFLDPENRCRVAKDNELLYWDAHHLTVEGSRLLLPLFEPIFKTN